MAFEDDGPFALPVTFNTEERSSDEIFCGDSWICFGVETRSSNRKSSGRGVWGARSFWGNQQAGNGG